MKKVVKNVMFARTANVDNLWYRRLSTSRRYHKQIQKDNQVVRITKYGLIYANSSSRTRSVKLVANIKKVLIFEELNDTTIFKWHSKNSKSSWTNFHCFL